MFVGKDWNQWTTELTDERGRRGKSALEDEDAKVVERRYYCRWRMREVEGCGGH